MYKMIFKFVSLNLVVFGCIVNSAFAVWQETVDVNSVHYRWGEPEIPSEITSFRNPDANIPWTGTVISPANYAPTGLYAGEYGNAVWDYSFTKVVERNGNSYYIGGSPAQPYFPSNTSTDDSASRTGQVAVARRAARLGLRLYYQNHNSEMFWPQRITNTAKPRSQVYAEIDAWSNAMMQNFLSSERKQGILVWGLSEEIDIETAQDTWLTDCRNNLFKARDPYHPALIMLMANNPAIQTELYTMWGEDIPIIVIDSYCNNRGVTRANAWSYYKDRMSWWQTMSMNHGNDKLWVVMGCFSENNNTPSQGTAGWWMMTPEEMNMSCWTGLAYGASGFYLFREYADEGHGRAALTRFDWKPTEEYMAAARFFRVFRRLESLTSKWYPAAATVVASGFAKCTMLHPDFSGQFVVIANTSTSASASYAVPTDANYYDMESFNSVAGSISMLPGMGTVLFKGSAIEVEELETLIGAGAGAYMETSLAASEKQLWQTGSGNEETVATRTGISGFPVTFGGKGGKPYVYSEEQMTSLPSYAGELLTWGTGVKMPAGMYYPPRAGANEKMLFLKWDLSSFSALTDKVDSAAFEVQIGTGGILGGRLGIYPVVGDGNDLLYTVMEYMPRWEKDAFTVSSGGNVRFEIGGMVQEWINGDMSNRGLLVVYNGWPDTTNSVAISSIGSLNLKYYGQPDTCDSIWQAGYGLASDFDRNCIVDFRDFAFLAQRWFECNNPQDPNCF